MAFNNLRSPGVQITEKDLSLRSNFNPGTNIVVTGFAPQGPISEPIFISTASELETIYGVPASPAERYFYYSCREVLNSAGSLVAMRLPYGTATGTGYSQNFAALFYPMSQVTVFATEQSEYNTFAGLTASVLTPGTSATTLSTLNSLTTLTGISGVTAPVSAVALKIQSTSLSAAFFANVETYYASISSDKVSWEIKAPQHVNLTEDQFNSIRNGDFNWDAPTSATNSFYVSAGELRTKAGFFILNTLQTTINEVGEGFYIGFADNTALYENSPNFESIQALKTLTSSATATNTFAGVNTNRLDFSLSATTSESNRGINSISENLEKVGFIGFESDDYQDHISLGVFRVRRSVADASLLTLGTTEKFLGSFDFARKQTNLAGGDNPPSAFLEDVINDTSALAKVYVNPAISKAFDWTEGSTLPANRVTVSSEAKALFPFGSYARTIYNDEANKIIGEVPEKLDKTLRFIENTENILVDVVIDGGLSNIYSTTKYASTSAYQDEETFINDTAVLYDNWKAVTDVFVTFAEKIRKDCIAVIDMPRNIFVQGKNQKVIDAPGKNFTTDIYNHLRDFVGPYESNFVATYANWVKINDLFTGRKVWMPFSAYAAAIFANNDAVAFPWTAPAGLNRGIFNVIDIAFNPNLKQRDRLYEISVNPVVYFAGDGFAIYGQKTLQTKPTAFDRINVRRLFLTLERATQRALKYFVFEPNTEFTRLRLRNTIAPLFEFAKNNEGLYDYLIVCDERNNLPETIDNNELIVDIYLKPVRTAEFILVNFIATRTGQNFSELI